MTPRISNIRNQISKARNFYFPSSTFEHAYSMPATAKDVQKHVSYYITKVQFQRIRQDIQSWRQAIQQAEQMFYPFRSEMQRIYIDTVLNEHTSACMERRKNLTLLRDFKICDDKGVEDESLKLIFRNKAKKDSGNWFEQFVNYSLDAIFYGYSLIELGDIINDAFPDIDVVRRENISPDRLNVSSLPQMVGGIPFTEQPYSDWNVWVSTPGQTGREACGYGLLYKVAKAEIYERNNTAFNADSNEVFGQPIRKGTTTKTDPDERNAFENFLKNMGSQAYILLDEGEDKVELIESQSIGRGYLTYQDFEKRQQQKISKVLLGHADAIDSVPGKLGSGSKTGGDESPQSQAMDEIQVKDGSFIENVINGELIPRMQKFGFRIPPNFHFEFLNNKENEEFRNKEDKSNKVTADIAFSMAQAGLQMDANYFTERTGIPTTLIPKPAPIVPDKKEQKIEEPAPAS